jgi:hypothetical protein
MKYQWANPNTGMRLPEEDARSGDWIRVPEEVRDAAGIGETWEVTIRREGRKPRVVSLEAPDYEHPGPVHTKI